MSKYKIKIEWKSDVKDFTQGEYSRKHKWKFDGGLEITASSSPSVVPIPFSIEEAVDPEEAFICSISSCHMLWFLDLAAKKGINIHEYNDEAIGIMKNKNGAIQITDVQLHPKITGIDGELDKNLLEQLHHEAHKRCFIANSVKTNIEVIF
ncbi:OsmC family protein [Gracilimonas sp.]|uniref:OsmC family protein n=1 Tax=Gracilimonas sp. TaxID=1974203 RepID=UPI0032EACEF9